MIEINGVEIKTGDIKTLSEWFETLEMEIKTVRHPKYKSPDCKEFFDIDLFYGKCTNAIYHSIPILYMEEGFDAYLLPANLKNELDKQYVPLVSAESLCVGYLISKDSFEKGHYDDMEFKFNDMKKNK